MRIIILLILLFCSILLKGQDTTKIHEDSLISKPKKNIQLYFAPSYTVIQFVETRTSFAGTYLGLIFRKKIEISVSYSKMLNNFRKQIIFPSVHKYDQTNLGLQGQYSFLKNKICPHIGLGVQYGTILWEPEYDSNDTFTDHIYIYEFFLGASWLINKTFAIQGNAGYNSAKSVDIVGLNSNDFNGFSVDLILKINLLKF